MRLATRVAWIAAWTIALIFSPSNALAQDGCLADLNDDGIVNGTDLAIVIGGWGPCPVNTTFVGGVVKAGGVPVPGAMVATDLGGKTVAGEGGIFLLEIELPSVIETVVLSATAEIDGVGFEGTKTVSPVNVGGSNLVGLIEVSSGGCDTGFGWVASSIGLPGFDDQGPRAFAIFDDGSGPALFAAGSFQTAGGVSANGIAKWDGQSWTPLAAGLNGQAHALAVFDDGTGPSLYVGGSFTAAGGLPARNVARWDGGAWWPVGAGLGNDFDYEVVRVLEIFDDGSGPSLYAGGSFFIDGGQYPRGMARWDGSTWTAFFGSNTREFSVTDLAVADLGQGNQLYAAGKHEVSGNFRFGLHRWSGTQWVTELTVTIPQVTSGELHTAVLDSGEGQQIYLGGFFTQPETYILRWDGTTTFPLVDGVNGGVRALGTWDVDASTSLIVGGDFSVASTVNANRVARWDGSSWSPLGNGLDATPLGIFSHESTLYFGGFFSMAGGQPANRIAQWGCITP